ncbi:TPA: gamma carbonic anhydrase family protein [Candidatus Bipolaricaulota bacterium]|nr:gamma carbonic anhydrase family protein [Candidatus Bipolaricaulota bacterium]
MTVYQFEGQTPRIGEGTYIHPSAEVIGKVIIGRGCWIGPGARIRGDYGEIVIGDETSIEDNCVIHARPGERCLIGSRVTIGHGAIIHNATIEDYAVIGMGAVVSDWASVGEWAVVGEGAVVKNSQEVPAEHIAVGVPAKILDRRVTQEYKEQWKEFKQTYVDLAHLYARGLREI